MSLVYERANMLKSVRAFFDQRSVLEVDCTHLLEKPQVDAHIDVMKVEGYYLHTSPEYEMKKLLAKGAPDIYQLSKVYRSGEKGSNHHPEFTMIEWYRLGFTLDRLIEETITLIQLFLKPRSFKKITYEEIMGDAIDDYHFSHHIQPHLNAHIVTDFPPSEAALSRVIDGKAKRFEIFIDGKEVANGYLELTDPEEHRRRFIEQNRKRKEMGKKEYLLDEEFLSLIGDMPDACGVSVGFDRLMMLHLNKSTIKEVLPGFFSSKLATK